MLKMFFLSTWKQQLTLVKNGHDGFLIIKNESYIDICFVFTNNKAILYSQLHLEQ